MREIITAAVVIRGDQYSLQIQIKLENSIISTSNSDSVRIKVGNIVYSSADGLTFEGECWLFPLSQELTRSLEGGVIQAQAQVKIGEDIYTTPIYLIKIEDSIFEDSWE